MIRIITRNWLPKLGSLVLAILLWLFVSNSSNVDASREFTIPVIYNGLENDQIVRGAPPSVLVKVLGKRNQLNALEPVNFSAFIDFRETDGEYEKDIQVVLPPGVDRLLSVTPRTAIGTVESIATKTVPVEASLIGSAPSNKQVNINLPISEANVLGFSSSLEQVTKVVATVPADASNTAVSLFAANENNQPIRDTTLTVAPASIIVSVGYEDILFKKRIALNILEPSFEGIAPERIRLSSIQFSQDSIEVVGASELLEPLEEVAASVESITGELRTGEYTLQVVPDLPEGVTATEVATMTLSVTVLPEEAPDDGESDDSASSTLR